MAGAAFQQRDVLREPQDVGCCELPALSGVLGPAARADGVLFRQSGFRIRRPRLSTGTGLSAPDMDQNFPNRADPVDLGRHGNSESSTDAFGPAFMGGSRYAN